MIKFFRIFKENKLLKEENKKITQKLLDKELEQISNNMFMPLNRLDISRGVNFRIDDVNHIQQLWDVFVYQVKDVFLNDNTAKYLYCYLRFILFNSELHSNKVIEEYILLIFRKAGLKNEKISEYQTFFISKFKEDFLKVYTKKDIEE